MSFNFSGGSSLLHLHYGISQASSFGSGELFTHSAGGAITYETYTGRGYIYYFSAIVSTTATHSHRIRPYITLDNVPVSPMGEFQELNADGYDINTDPLRLMKYAVDGVCGIEYFFNPPLRFDTRLLLKGWLGTHTAGEDPVIRARWYYTKY